MPKSTKVKKAEKLEKPAWLKSSQKEVEKIIVDLAKQGIEPAKIGLILRDSYGIPKAKLYGKKIMQILKENSIQINPDLKNVSEKAEKIKKHLEKNKQDKKAKRALQIIEARKNKLTKYHNKKG